MKQKGFTLIELLVVIAIIGLLSSLAIVSLNSARQKAFDAQIKSDIGQIRNLIEVNATDGGTYVDPITTLTPPACSDDATYGVAVGDGTTYVIWADMCVGANDWCSDSTGFTGDATVGANPTACQ